MINLDGSPSSLVQLTNNNAVERVPRWSPDGTKIVFARQWPATNPVICTMNADGTGETALTSYANNSFHPDWSPDGGRIAYRGGMLRDLYTMYADGSAQTKITDSPASRENHPSWSPDGTTLAFSTTAYGMGILQIATVNAYGGPWTQLTDDVDFANVEPAYSPVAELIAYTSDRNGVDDVFTMTTGGTARRNRTESPSNDSTPRWSSDGRLIAFTSTRTGNKDVWIREVDPPHRQWQVTRHGANDQDPDLGSPTKQTDRVLIGPAGSDLGADPIYPSAPAVIAAFDSAGYRNLVRIGVAPAHLPGLQFKPLANAGWQLVGVEVSASSIANLREDAGWGRPPTLWDFSALNPGAVLLYFRSHTGKLVSAVPLKDAVYSAEAGETGAAYTSSVQGDALVLTGDLLGVLDAEGRNLAPDGASSVTLSGSGEVLAVN